MTCKYIYNGNTFNSELELDNYLLFHKTLRTKLGDAAFKLSEKGRWSEQQYTIDAALNKSQEEYEAAENKRYIRESSEEGEPSELDQLQTTNGILSITEIIKKLRQPNSNNEMAPVFPEFISKNYWEGTPANPGGQKGLYRTGQFQHKSVVGQLPFVEDLIPKLNGQLQRVTDEETLNKIEERMTEIWKQQALCGDLLHNIMSDFFKSKTNDGKIFSSLSEDDLVSALTEKLEESYYNKYRKFIKPEIIQTTAQAAIKILENIKHQYGDDCVIYSEKKIIGQGYEGETSTFPVVGRIDLMVVSKSGKIGIFDFKCSPKEYTEFNNNEDITKYDPAKVLTFKYQLAAYRRLVNSIINTDADINLGIIPLKFENFIWNKNTKHVEFSHISFKEDSPIQELSNTKASTGGPLYNTIENNLDQIFPRSKKRESIVTQDLLVKVSENSKKIFKIKKRNKSLTDEEIVELIKEKGGIKRNSITQKWEFKENKDVIYQESGKKSKEEAETSIFNMIKEKHKYVDNYVLNTTEDIRKEFKRFKDTGDEVPLLGLAYRASFGQKNPIWIQNKFKKYMDSTRWEIVENSNYDPIFDQLGILMFRNKKTNLIDVIKISDYYDPTQKVEFASKNRTTLLGSFLSDDVVKSDTNQQVLDGVGGNVELMETMLALNEIPTFFNEQGVGTIEVISPRAQKGLTATNEQLLYNFKRLCKLGEITNNFKSEEKSGKIKMVDRVSSCRYTFEELLSSHPEEGGLGKIMKNIKDEVQRCISMFDDFGKNPIILRQELIDLDKMLTGNNEFDYGYKNLNRETADIPNENDNPEYLLHKQILYAISQLSGVNLLQQIEDHARIQLISEGFHFKGVVGTAIDNPGTLQSRTLNSFTEQVTIAYQNTRDNVIAFNQELRKRVEALKKAKGFGLIQQYGVGNQTEYLYKNMYDEETEDDLLFKNPWDMSNNLLPEEREFLKFALLKINDNRNKNFDPTKIEEEIATNPKKYLRVPLTKGDLSSEVATRNGWLNFIKARFAMLAPKKLYERLKDRYDKQANGLIDDQQYKEKLDRGKFWEALNQFDAGEEEDSRLKLLSNENLGGVHYFEHNLETLLLKHTSAYKMAEELNNIFPVLRALTLNLNLQGSILNTEFTHDIDYILTYVKNRIHNRPVENRENMGEAFIADVIKRMMSTTSKLALAFNPRQWYQFIDGIWKDITMFVKYYNDENNPFTREGLFKGWKIVMEDLRHLGNDFTMSELLNQQYGFNDMDVNSYIDRIKTDNTGMLYHFWNVGFRFASRPDFYNRMTLFYAQMYKDGSLDAHKVVDGKLIYDWTKDKRFDLFAKYKGNDSIVPASEKEKYNKQKSLYITIARQFMQEGTKNSDGSLFKLDLSNPQALPKAYTNRDSESFKAISDRIYGYYAHEKKSMIHSYGVGSLFMQMNTFWSAKKNQYAQVRSYTQEGKWVDYEEDGFKYCWSEDEDGDLIPKRIEKPEDDTGVAVKVWKGRPQEGIGVTCVELGYAFAGKSELTSKSGISGMWHILTNEEIDPELRRLYQANVRQLFADLLIWLLVGELMMGSITKSVDEHIRKVGNDKFGKAFANNSMLLGTNLLKASTDDANFLKSILGRGKDWTPFAIKQADRISNNFYRLVRGKQDVFDFATKLSGFGRSTIPGWDYAKITLTGEKIGEKKST